MTGGPCACTALRKASRAVSRFYDDALAQSGLSTPQFAILRHLARMGDPPLSRLAEELVMDRTSLYRALKPMVRDGWIVEGEAGARAKTASLTPKGRQVMENAEPAWAEAQGRFVADLGPELWETLRSGLNQAVEATRV